MSWARNVLLVDPGAEGRAGGNRVTALRWAMILRRLGHRPRRAARFDGRPADVLVALHAVRSADSIDAFRARFPGGGVVVALTGTDLHDAAGRDRLERSLALADAVVVLHEGALPLLPDAARGKARVIVQSVELPREPPPPPSGFQVCVLANLRAVKDPLLGARAAMLLPASSRARVVLAGTALDPALAAEARALMARTLRFAWLGPLRRRAALRLLQGSGAAINSSRSEGGANAVGEAIVAGVPPLVSAIPGSLGLLGADWPATFPPGDARALCDLILRVERDGAFRDDLVARLRALAPRFARAVEVAAWQRLLAELPPVA